MKMGIMQPYIFPYIGYFQLINSVEKFVFYDDVNFIKQGWINRNRILLNDKEFLFSVPLKDVSSFKAINEVMIDEKSFLNWKGKFYKTIEGTYKKAPYFPKVIEIVKAVIDSNYKTIAEMALKSILTISECLNITTEFIYSSSVYQNNHLKAQNRVIDICLKENASCYINLSGGGELYSKKDFLENKLILNLLKTKPIYYKQFNNAFVPNLSIIDVIMFNPTEVVQEMLHQYELL